MNPIPILSVLLFLSFPLQGQSTQPGARVDVTKSHYIKRLGPREGLSQPSITSVLTDSDGTVWIGTRYRLNKYVNGNLSAYDSNPLGGAHINLVFEDDGNNLWVATDSELFRYDKESDTFCPFLAGRFFCAAELAGQVYFAGSGDIVAIDTATETLSLIPNEGSRLVKAIVLDADTLLFVDNERGLFTCDTGSGRLERFPTPELDGELILCAEMIDNYIYIGSYLNGLYQLDCSGKLVRHYSPEDCPGLRLAVICDICLLDGRVCLATDGNGICTIEDGRILPLKDLAGYADLAVLPPALTRIYQDPFSNIWAGSVKDGLFGIRPTSIHRIEDFAQAKDNPAEKDVILCLSQDGKDLWIGTDNGVIVYDPEAGTARRIASTRGNIISSMCLFGKDALLVSAYCQGLYVLGKTSGIKTPLPIVNRKVDMMELNSGYVPVVFNVSDTDILVSGQNSYRYHLGEKEFSTFSVDFRVDPSSLHPFHVGEGDGTALAHSRSAVFKIDLIRDRISVLLESGEQGRINSAAKSGGKIYLGTDTGLFTFDEASGQSEQLYAGAFSRVTQISPRSDCSLWIVADNVLYSYDTATRKVEVFDEAEGFMADEVNTCVRLGDTFYFGGNYDLTSVPSDIRKKEEPAPILSLSQVIMDGQAVVPEKGRLRVRPRFKNLRLEFRLRGGDPFSRTLLRYVTDGSESGQIRTYDNTCLVSSLPPGKHTVSASFFQADGTWSTAQEFLTILVPDVLWRQKWFISLLAMLLAGASLLFVRRVLQRANAEAQSAIRENRQEDERRRSRFVQSIDLELSQPLSQITKSAQQLLLSEPSLPEKAKTGLERIYSKSVQMEKTLSEAVEQEQAARPEDPLLEKFNRIIEDNLQNPGLNVSFLTGEMAMSRSVLYDKIKALTGMGVNDYIQRYRLHKARKNLIETDRTIAEISDDVGFSSPKYFGVVFKSAFGMTPREFRKRMSNR